MSSPKWEIKEGTPRRFAVLLYRQWEAIDVMGPCEALNTLSRNTSKDDFVMDIIAAESGEYWSSSSTAPERGPGSRVNQQMVPTHNYFYNPEKPDADLLKDIPAADVLIVPGGLGPTKEEGPGVIEFIKQYYNKYLKGQANKYLFTVCTGSNLAAKAGCLKGVYATTNKVAWNYVTSQPWSAETYWIARSRWVDDERHSIWTTSGVSAGTDGMIAFIRKVYGQDKDTVYFSKKVSDGMEWIAAQSHTNDPFAYDHETGQPLKDVPGKSGLEAPVWESS